MLGEKILSATIMTQTLRLFPRSLKKDVEVRRYSLEFVLRLILHGQV
jgi:hypothetical protein